ncbi:uncharacterized protein LOC117166726 [Bombus vancouverensis nearcticus]|uniref:uncharacterized protein LOC117166726 n=1 Tax=Bombus vancouverensis nearcticus TaxID=2705178 RepID=UPI00402B208D
MTEMREFTTIVRRARDNLRYISERVAIGMNEIEEDVGKELRVTGRITTQSANLAAVLRRFTGLEENVIELVRMDRNRENAKVETPVDVTTEIERVVAAAERKSAEDRRVAGENDGVEEAERVGDGAATRNPLSKFSACGHRETGAVVARKSIDGRSRVRTTPEVRLLGESRHTK